LAGTPNAAVDQLATGPNGNIYALDQGNSLFDTLTSDGTMVNEVPVINGTALAASPSGAVYVGWSASTVGIPAIHVYNANGAAVTSWPISYPPLTLSVFVDSISVDPLNGDVYAAVNIQGFSGDVEHLMAWSPGGTRFADNTSTFLSVNSVTDNVYLQFSPDGSHLFVAYGNNGNLGHALQVVDPGTLGATHLNKTNFSNPTGLAVLPDGSQVFVSDNGFTYPNGDNPIVVTHADASLFGDVDAGGKGVIGVAVTQTGGGCSTGSQGGSGYYEVASDGGLFAFNAPFYGSMGGKPLNQPIVGMTYDPLTGGYYEVASDGGLFAFNTPFQGSMGGKPLNKPIVAMAFDPVTGGYYEVASDGGLFAFNAPFYGSMGGKPLNSPIVGMTVDPTTGGYYEVASDGGLFAFNAPFQGSMGGHPLNKPIVGMTFDSLTGGYYEVASDGGLFAFNAPFYGSMGGKPLNKPIVGMEFDSSANGYYEVATDGGLFAFNAPFQGSMGGKPLNKPIVGMAAAG
jgi:hypothetical protein